MALWGLNERPMLLLWVECGTLVLLLWWRNGRRGALKMRYLYGVRVRIPPGALGLVDLRTFPAGMFPLWRVFLLSTGQPCFCGGIVAWSSSHRDERFNPDWPRVRAMILERDGHRCQWPVKDDYGNVRLCGRYGNEVDHKVRNPVHDDDRPENLWVLCRWHHQRKTEGESAEVRRAKGRSRREKRWYSHPAFK